MLDMTGLLRILIFFSVFLIMAFWEIVLPRRPLRIDKKVRWVHNLGITFLNGFLIRMIAPLGAVTFAVWAASTNTGFFNSYQFNPIMEFILSILLLDLTLFTQHFMFHHIKLLGKLHQMHHLDLDLDVTSGTRFHPVEMLISMGLKGIVIITAGCSPLSTLVFEIILNATAMFNHGNVYLPEKADLIIRKFIVTPDMHRVHHSVIERERNSNYGFALSIWDRIFGTYVNAPEAGQKGMTIGLPDFQDISGFLALLIFPFRRRK